MITHTCGSWEIGDILIRENVSIIIFVQILGQLPQARATDDTNLGTNLSLLQEVVSDRLYIFVGHLVRGEGDRSRDSWKSRGGG